MKKYAILFAALGLVVGVTACQKKEAPKPAAAPAETAAPAAAPTEQAAPAAAPEKKEEKKK